MTDAAAAHSLSNAAQEDLNKAASHLEVGFRRLVRENFAREQVIQTNDKLQKALDAHVDARYHFDLAIAATPPRLAPAALSALGEGGGGEDPARSASASRRRGSIPGGGGESASGEAVWKIRRIAS